MLIFIRIVTAAKVKIAVPLFINKNCRIKKPVNLFAGWSFTRNQSFSKRINKWSNRRICCKNSDSICGVCKIKEKLILPLNFFTGNCRSPGVSGPLCCSCEIIFSGNSNLTAVCPVNHIFSRKNIQRVNFIIAVINFTLCKFQLLHVICRINIECILVFKNSRICPIFMSHNRIIFSRHFKSFFSHQLLHFSNRSCRNQFFF